MEAEERIADQLFRSGAVSDQKTSRRVVRTVVQELLSATSSIVPVTEADVYNLDDEAYSILEAVWEIEETGGDSREKLLEIVGRAQHILRIARGYLVPDHFRDIA